MKNKDTKLIILLAFFAIVGMVTMFSKCERVEVLSKVTPPVHIESDTIPIDTVILDKKTFLRSVSYHIVILCDGYKGQSGLNLFLQDQQFSRATIMHYLSTCRDSVTGLYLDTSRVAIHYRNVKQNLSCNDNVSLNEGLACSDLKVLAAVGNVASAGGFTANLYGVLANGKGGGGGYGYFAVGMGNHVAGANCTFYEGAGEILIHEIFHVLFCICHVDNPPNKLSGAYTTNGGCELIGLPILQSHQQILYNLVHNAN